MYAVEMRGITKEYPLVRALDQVDFTLREGEILSLLGENGAGKSTLMKVLYGMCRPDAGEIRIRGEKVDIRSPKQAIDLGIGMVHQHFMLIPVMTVAENIVVGHERSKGPVFHQAEAEKKVQEMIDRYGFGIRASQKVSELSVGEQQKVEILKAIYREAEILILDEPTAVLTPQEVEELFRILRDLREQKKSIVIITHKLKETLAIADSVSVLRDGKMIQAGIPVQGATADELAQMMVGREVTLGVSRKAKKVGETVLRVRDLVLTEKGRTLLNHVSLELKRGEILGIAGIEGNGQTELIECLTGIWHPDVLDMEKDGKKMGGGPDAFIHAGIGHIPEDRMTRGLILELSLQDNLILGYQDRFQRRGILDPKKIREFSERLLKEFGVKAPGPMVKAGSLSGGNQQKVVIARVFSENPDIIIVAQPTRGVDIGAMEYIHERLLDLRDEGKAILLISADLDEVKTLSDRLTVMYGGQLVAEGRPEEFDDMELGLLMTGAMAGKKGGVRENGSENH